MSCNSVDLVSRDPVTWISEVVTGDEGSGRDPISMSLNKRHYIHMSLGTEIYYGMERLQLG